MRIERTGQIAMLASFGVVGRIIFLRHSLRKLRSCIQIFHFLFHRGASATGARLAEQIWICVVCFPQRICGVICLLGLLLLHWLELIVVSTSVQNLRSEVILLLCVSVHSRRTLIDDFICRVRQFIKWHIFLVKFGLCISENIRWLKILVLFRDAISSTLLVVFLTTQSVFLLSVLPISIRGHKCRVSAFAATLSCRFAINFLSFTLFCGLLLQNRSPFLLRFGHRDQSLILALEFLSFLAEESFDAGVVLSNLRFPLPFRDSFQWALENVRFPRGFYTASRFGPLIFHGWENVALESWVVAHAGGALWELDGGLDGEVLVGLVAENVWILKACSCYGGDEHFLRVVSFFRFVSWTLGEALVRQDWTLEGVVLSWFGTGALFSVSWVGEDVCAIFSGFERFAFTHNWIIFNCIKLNFIKK